MTTFVPGNPTSAQPATEGVREFLKRRERELTQQISALRGQIAPMEQELAEVRKAMVALGDYAGALLAFAGMDDPLAPQRNGALTVPEFGLASLGPALVGSTLTIKQMIDGALRNHFHDGATPAELRGYLKTVYGRDVDRNSISPQLARMRDEGRVVAEDGKWKLSHSGQLFNHPTSWNVKDEPVEGEP